MTAAEANGLFDGLTGASYMGFHFRSVLMTNEKAAVAARTLVEELTREGVVRSTGPTAAEIEAAEVFVDREPLD